MRSVSRIIVGAMVLSIVILTIVSTGNAAGEISFIDQIGGYTNLFDLIGTYGLAVVIVVYFIFYRDPKNYRYFQVKYDDLNDNYTKLKDCLTELEKDFNPESRSISTEQARVLCHIALDRDLYKLYFYVVRKLDGYYPEKVNNIVSSSILDTNQTWSKFISPFKKVPRISDLYGIYRNEGSKLVEYIEGILNSDEEIEDKKKLLWDKFCQDTITMKREFEENLDRLRKYDPVLPFGE